MAAAVMGIDRRNCATALLLAGLGSPACLGVQPYEAWPESFPDGLPADAFQRIVQVLTNEYGGVVMADPAGFRLQSRWHPHQPGEIPGEKRATIYRESDHRLRIAVEVRWLRMGLFSTMPEWSAPEGAAHLERDLGDQLQAALH